MADDFTAEWAAAAAELWPLLPPADGAEGTVSLAVSVAPRREVALHWSYEGGRPVAGGPGAGDVDLALTLGAADAREVLAGRVEPSVAFMRGRLKASGDGGLLLAVLSSTTADAFEGWRGRVEALTTAGA